MSSSSADTSARSRAWRSESRVWCGSVCTAPAISAALAPSAAELLWIVDVYPLALAGLLVTAATVGALAVALGGLDGPGVVRVPWTLLGGLTVAGAAAFLTPVATPANLMVLQPGRYRFGDYWKLGLPLMVVYLAVAVLYVPLVWPF